MWLIDKLFNRKIEGKSSLDALEPVADKLANGYIKTGTYIVDDGDFIWVEDIPSNYSGHCIIIGDDGIMYLSTYTDGELTFELEFSSSGVSKVYPSVLVGLTHSLNELDPLLKQLIEDAITTQEEVACTQAQWNVIKNLLEESLYLNYNGYSLIKSYFVGINEYHFGSTSGDHGEALYFLFYENKEMLSVNFNEV